MCPKIKHRNIKSQNWAPKNQTRASYHEYVISTWKSFNPTRASCVSVSTSASESLLNSGSFRASDSLLKSKVEAFPSWSNSLRKS
nr:hypothetical protein CFP56_53765 [Quercus suber]